MNKSFFVKTIKLLLFALIIPFVAISAQDRNTITLNIHDVTLEKVMDEIEQQTNYLFLNDGVDVQMKISASVQNANVNEALKQIFAGKPVSFRLEGSNIFIYPKSNDQSKETFTVKGYIADEQGFPVIGAAVLLEGSTQGTTTDVDGNFSLTLPSSASNAKLHINCLGYTDVVLAIAGKSSVNIVLKEDNMMIQETVVTALGIKRSEKALSYNAQTVSSDQVLTNKDANFVNSLSGKVAGLVINASASGVGGASKVVMRGQKSITSSSNALYVIDGVPMGISAKEQGTGFDSRGMTDPIADLNPEDIESMTVLTGAAAAALYGSSAANGAIIINTKKGKEGKTSITLTSNTEVFAPFVLPRFQNQYGTGDYNSAGGSIVRSWGPKLNSYNNYGYSPARDYFTTGVTGTESISFLTGTSRNQTYLSAATVNSRGIVPNNNYDRYNFSLRNTAKFLDDKMTLDLSANYIMQNDRNMTNQGTYNNPLVGAYLFPRGNDWADVSMFERWDSSRKIHTQYWPVGDAGMTMQNPYWINYRNLRENKKSRYMFSAGLNYQVIDWLALSGRVRVDNSVNRYTEKFYASTNTQLTEYSSNGLYAQEHSEDKQVYADALLDINKRWEKFSVHANLGASITDLKFDQVMLRGPIADGIVDPSETPNIPNVFNLYALSQSKTVKKPYGWREQTQSVYGSLELGFLNAIFLNFTGRNDWPSQLAGPRSVNSSFFYPSAGLSVVASELIPSMPENLEYLKFRVSYASVGSPFSRWIANPLHSWPDKGNSWNTETSYPMDQLKPERTDSWEAGLSARLLKNFKLDLSYYNTHTKNQTFNPEISTGSGYSEIFIQSGDVLNEGVELSLGFDKQWGIFNWESNYTFSYNRNKIVSLAENAVNPVTGEALNITSLNMGGLGNARFILKEGGSLGDIYSRQDFVRDANGMIYIDQKGTVATKTLTKVEDYIKLGSVLPKSNMAWRNDFRIGNFNLGFMITARLGGVVVSRTQAILDYYGVSQASSIARDNGGVQVNGNNLVDANSWYTAIASGDIVPQYYTYSADNVRLQEASIGYTFPSKMLKGISELSIQIVGCNLFMIYNKAPFDPEVVASTGNYYQGVDYFMMPSTRNAGFNLRIKF